mmetsp:Transcript_23963/g.71304  ORF Transcript_23963/g.71304 Transcript_23963/m.71304 type:complete len:217 (-) Transcript_23963:134-784(-)
MCCLGITRCRPTRSRQSCTRRPEGCASKTAREASCLLRSESSVTPMSITVAGGLPSSPSHAKVRIVRYSSRPSCAEKVSSICFMARGPILAWRRLSMFLYLASYSSQLRGARADETPPMSKVLNGMMDSFSPSRMVLPARSRRTRTGSAAKASGSLTAMFTLSGPSCRPFLGSVTARPPVAILFLFAFSLSVSLRLSGYSSFLSMVSRFASGRHAW